jgi:drug/metabolite transporter (DMT)-like permease
MLASGLTNVGFNWAVTVGDVVRVVLLFYLMPAWSILLAWWLLDEKPTRGALLRLALALLGVMLVLKTPDSPWPLPETAADGLALMGGFCFALTNALLRKLQHTPDAARAVAMFAGGTFTATLVALAGVAHGVVPALPPMSVAWWPLALLLSAAFLAGNLALQYGAARLAAHMTALIMLSEVVFASLSAVLLGAAALSGRTVAGGCMIGLAALLAIWPSRPAPRT